MGFPLSPRIFPESPRWIDLGRHSLSAGEMFKKKCSYLGGEIYIYVLFLPLVGEMIQFDYSSIFQMG